MASQTAVDWSFEADYLQACSCDFGCPCEFQAPPTKGYCEGTSLYRVTTGHYQDVSLDGVSFGISLHFPGALHLGDGTVCLLIDERADERQREAILQIVSGQAGGLPFEVIATLVTNFLEPVYVPIEVEVNGTSSRMKMGDLVDVALEPIRNPVTGEPESIRIEHGTGFIFKGADACSGERCVSTIPGLVFSHPGGAGFVTKVSYPM